MTKVRQAREAVLRRPMLGDGIIAATLAALTMVELTIGERAPDAWPTWVLVLLVVLHTAPLVWRRRFPLCSAACVIGSAFLAEAVLAPLASVSIALYSATAYGRRPWQIPAICAFYLAPIGYEAANLPEGTTFPEARAELLALALAWALPIVVGLIVNTVRWRRRRRVLTAEQDARKAVSEERLRIARELHDVVAHHVSLMGVQAGAARIVLGGRNERASAVLSAIEDSSRHAVTELHHLLGVLRSDGEPENPTPQPGIDELPALVETAGRSSLAVEGEPRPLPRTVDVSAYRVVQEALTNSRKHAGSATTHVKLHYRLDALEIEIVDNGTGTKLKPSIGGHGLIGMRERVVQNGGELHAGPRPTGGFGVHAVFPLDGVPA